MFNRICRIAAAVCLGMTFAGTTLAADDTIRVATDSTFPPFEYYAGGKRTGFDIDLVDAIGKSMGKKIEWTDIDFKGLIPGIISKRFDMAASAIYITPERAKVVDFSDSYYPGGLVILVKKDNTTIHGPDDLAGKKVSVQVGTKSVGFLKDNYPKVDRVEVEKNEEMFSLVDTGRVDAAVTGKPAAKLYAQKNPGVKVIDKQITTEEYGFAISKDESGLVKAVNEALAKLKADGTYQKLVDRWFEGR